MSFDPTKPVQTRDGHAARILCTDLKNRSTPIIAAITNYADIEEVVHRYSNGTQSIDSAFETLKDLVNVPVVRYEFQNVWDGQRKTHWRYDAYDACRVAGQNQPGSFGVIRFTFTDDVLTNVEIYNGD